MREDLLHYIWKYRKIPLKGLVTVNNRKVEILEVGQHNLLAGPDFSNAKIRIDDQLWAGNVEIHVKSSDWYVHGHERDTNYSSVILHVVWEEDTAVFRSNERVIPTLELKQYIPENLLGNYKQLLDTKKKRFVNCEREMDQIDSFALVNWLDRLYFERLEDKSNWVWQFLKDSKNDWEKLLFVLLLRNFGSKINQDAFSSLGRALDYSVLRKVQNDPMKMESLLLGLAGLLEDDLVAATYYLTLQKEYRYLRSKFSLQDKVVQRPEFFKLRPANFPTIRLSQLANLYGRYPNLFSTVIATSSLADLYSIFSISASTYWDTHYTFGKESDRRTKKLTKTFVDLLIINTILPLKLCFAKYRGEEIYDEIATLVSQLKKESNTITRNFEDIGIKVGNAMESQALLQLYNVYCSRNRCLECAVGSIILDRNT